MSTASPVRSCPKLVVPDGGWDYAAAVAAPLDVTSVPRSEVYLYFVEYKVRPGKARDFARGMESTEGKYFRLMPGCLACVFGLSSQDPDVALGTAIWKSREVAADMPCRQRDLERLNEARAPFMDMVMSKTVRDTAVTFGVGEGKHSEVQKPPAGGWDVIMGMYGRRTVLPNSPESNVYVVQVEAKAQEGKGEDVAKGFEATMGRFYRNQPGCHAYLFGLSSNDQDTVRSVAIWSSKEMFDSLPQDPKDLAALNVARAPFMKLLRGTTDDALKIQDTSVTFGDALYSDHFEYYSHGVHVPQ